MSQRDVIDRGSIVWLPQRVPHIYRFPDLPMRTQALNHPAVVLSRPEADRNMVWLCTMTSVTGVPLLQQAAFNPTDVVPIVPALDNHPYRGTLPEQPGHSKDEHDYNLLQLEGNDQMRRPSYVIVREVYCTRLEDLGWYVAIDGSTMRRKWAPGVVDDVSITRLCRLCSEKNPGWYPWSPWPEQATRRRGRRW